MRRLLALLALCLMAWGTASNAHAQNAAQALVPAQTIAHGLFSDVQLYRPPGAIRQFVMLLSTRAAPGDAERRMLRTMTAAGALVAFVPLEPFYERLQKQDGKCTYAGGAFENLSRRLQAFEQLPTYLLPMLVGSGDAAAFVYAVLAQTPAGVFGSAMSIGFCPRLPALPFRTPMCANNLLRSQPAASDAGIDLQPAPTALAAPWTVLQVAEPACVRGTAQTFAEGTPGAHFIALGAASHSSAPADVPPTFEAAYAHLATRHIALAPPPTQLANLPIVEAPVPGAGSRFAVLLSGDGGWAGIDKGIAAALVAQGIPVAGFDSLRYFWSARTPEVLAADLDRVIRYYAARWKRSEVILIGYSQGADVLPFAYNRLPPATRAMVRLSALLGPGQKASFEFHLGNWIGTSGDVPIAPEARQLSAAGTICIYGQTERDSLCPSLAPDHVRPIPLAGGHHFSGDYEGLAMLILKAAPPSERR